MTHLRCATSLHTGKFLYNNYVQCLAIINENTAEIDKLKTTSNLQDADLEGWLIEECRFLQDLKDEPESKILECAYVRALEKKRKAE